MALPPKTSKRPKMSTAAQDHIRQSSGPASPISVTSGCGKSEALHVTFFDEIFKNSHANVIEAKSGDLVLITPNMTNFGECDKEGIRKFVANCEILPKIELKSN